MDLASFTFSGASFSCQASLTPSSCAARVAALMKVQRDRLATGPASRPRRALARLVIGCLALSLTISTSRFCSPALSSDSPAGDSTIEYGYGS